MPALPAARRVARAGRPREGRPVPRRDRTGAGRCRDSATRTRGSCWSGWRRRRTAATGPAGSSPATRRATSCGRRCIGRGLADRAVEPPRRRRPDPDRHVHRRRRPLRAAGQQADDRGARHLRAVPRPRDRAAVRAPGRRRARSVRLGRRRSGRSRRSVTRPGRCRGSAMPRRSRSGRTRSSARTTRASRTRSPGALDRPDVRSGPRAGPRDPQGFAATQRLTNASRRSKTTPSSAAAESMKRSSIAIRWPRPMHSGWTVTITRPLGACSYA